MSAFPSVPFEAPSVARATASAVRRRLSGDYDVDEWGLDPDLISTFDPLFALRWSIRVVGTENLPTIGGALLVFNRRLGISEPWSMPAARRIDIRFPAHPQFASVRERLWQRYGMRWHEVAALVAAGDDRLLVPFAGTAVLEVELLQAIEQEMAVTLADLVRRTGLGAGGSPGR